MKKRGSLTVEAAIILPIVLISWLTIINFLNMYFIHITIQQALNNTAKRLSEYAYLVERTNTTQKAIDVFKLSNDTADKATNIRENIDKALDSANTVQTNVLKLSDNVKQAGDNISDIKSNTNEIFNGMGSGDMSSISNNIVNIENSGKKLVNNFQNIKISKIKSEIIEPAKEFGNAIKSTYEVMKTINSENIKDYFVSELANMGTGMLVGAYVNIYIKDLNIEQMKDVSPLYFYSSKFFYGDDSNTFAISVAYKYKNPLGPQFFKSVEMHQTAVMNMWIGDESSDIRTLIKKK